MDPGDTHLGPRSDAADQRGGRRIGYRQPLPAVGKYRQGHHGRTTAGRAAAIRTVRVAQRKLASALTASPTSQTVWATLTLPSTVTKSPQNPNGDGVSR